MTKSSVAGGRNSDPAKGRSTSAPVGSDHVISETSPRSRSYPNAYQSVVLARGKELLASHLSYVLGHHHRPVGILADARLGVRFRDFVALALRTDVEVNR